MSRVPHAKEEQKLNSNPLEIVFINGNITKCLGCSFKYQDSEGREPYDLVFKICMHHMRPFQGGTIWAQSNRKIPDIYMSNKTLSELSPMHTCPFTQGTKPLAIYQMEQGCSYAFIR